MRTGVHTTSGAARGLVKGDVPNGEANTHEGSDRHTAWHNSKGKEKLAKIQDWARQGMYY